MRFRTRPGQCAPLDFIPSTPQLIPWKTGGSDSGGQSANQSCQSGQSQSSSSPSASASSAATTDTSDTNSLLTQILNAVTGGGSGGLGAFPANTRLRTRRKATGMGDFVTDTFNDIGAAVDSVPIETWLIGGVAVAGVVMLVSAFSKKKRKPRAKKPKSSSAT